MFFIYHVNTSQNKLFIYSNLKSCCTMLISSSTLCPCLSSRTPPRSRGLRARADPNPARLLDDETRSFLRISGESDGGGSTRGSCSIHRHGHLSRGHPARRQMAGSVCALEVAQPATSVPDSFGGGGTVRTTWPGWRRGMRDGEGSDAGRRDETAPEATCARGTRGGHGWKSLLVFWALGLWQHARLAVLPIETVRRVAERDGARETGGDLVITERLLGLPSPSDATRGRRQRRGHPRSSATREQLLLCSYPSGLSRRRASIRCTSGPSVRNLAFALRGRRQRMPIPAREACRVHQELPRWIMDGWSYCSVHSEAVAR
jgi:hypothetical protein